VLSSEIKNSAIETYCNYFKEQKIAGDITEIDSKNIPDFDILLAGFPCQPFSNAGNRQGFLDTKGTLFFEIERILRDKKPFGFILENIVCRGERPFTPIIYLYIYTYYLNLVL
jgi:DNA (cytosine-5)-methyltransferase 1